MTTIAYRDGVIACDKQGTFYNQAAKSPFKAVVTDSIVYLLTGTLWRGLRFIEHRKSDPDNEYVAPKLNGTHVYEFDLDTGKLLVWEHHTQSMPVIDKIWADGSGGQFAMGAMAMGATPEEAVKVAIRYDVYTGGGVQSWASKKSR